MSEKIVQLNEKVIKDQLKELVRGSVEETLNELLEQEAEKLTQAARYERNEARQGYRSGHYDRNLTTTSGDVTLHVPRLKGVSFETAIIERYRRRESSVEEALIEMYLAGVSVRRVEDITEVLWGTARYTSFPRYRYGLFTVYDTHCKWPVFNVRQVILDSLFNGGIVLQALTCANQLCRAIL